MTDKSTGSAESFMFIMNKNHTTTVQGIFVLVCAMHATSGPKGSLPFLLFYRSRTKRIFYDKHFSYSYIKVTYARSLPSYSKKRRRRSSRLVVRLGGGIRFQCSFSLYASMGRSSGFDSSKPWDSSHSCYEIRDNLCWMSDKILVNQRRSPKLKQYN